MDKIIWSLNGICAVLQTAQTSDLYDDKTQNMFWMLGEVLEYNLGELEKLNITHE